MFCIAVALILLLFFDGHYAYQRWRFLFMNVDILKFNYSFTCIFYTYHDTISRKSL